MTEATANSASEAAVATGTAGPMNTIGILSLGGYDADPDRLIRARQFFEAQGRKVLIAPDPELRHQRFAATDGQRLAALEQMLADPAIDIVMALRGGYGMTRLLDQIDFAAVAHAIRSGGKRFVGHSDFTAFHLALLAHSAAVSFAGPMASYDFAGHGETHALSDYTLRNFDAVMQRASHQVRFAAEGPDVQAQGTLWGGNLAMTCSLIGTPWMPEVKGGVLFLEDIFEQPYRVERMLLQLHHAGILARQKAVLLGDFSGHKETAYDNGYDLAAVVSYLREKVSVPILTGLPFGHCPDKLTLPVGGQAQVDMAQGYCTLSLSDYSCAASALRRP